MCDLHPKIVSPNFFTIQGKNCNLNIPRSFGNAVQTAFSKILIFFLQKIKNFLYVLDRFDVLISKMIFKKIKKNHFDIF
jgi:hypothetical protein